MSIGDEKTMAALFREITEQTGSLRLIDRSLDNFSIHKDAFRFGTKWNFIWSQTNLERRGSCPKRFNSLATAPSRLTTGAPLTVTVIGALTVTGGRCPSILPHVDLLPIATTLLSDPFLATGQPFQEFVFQPIGFA
jgi:hypothetical protein